MTGGDGALALARFRFSLADVVERTWRFGVSGSDRAHAPHLKLLEDGRLGGHVVETEWTWELEDGVIVLFDRVGRRSTVFDQVSVKADGRLLLQGEFRLLPQGTVVHELCEITPVQTICASVGDMEMVFKSPRRRRANLLVVHANETSLHSSWTRDISDQDRNWDLCIGYYGRDENFGQDDVAEIQVMGSKYQKFPRMYKMFAVDSPLWNYEYIGFADDDLMTRWSDINELFVICKQFKLQIAQPSLTPDSHIIHPITERQPAFLLRYVSFVEFMMPIFATAALRACIATTDVTTLGFGIDNVWPKLIGEPMKAMAVIDRISVVHTRPPGGAYVHWDELQNGSAFQNLYDAPTRVLEFGGIYATPIPRQ